MKEDAQEPLAGRRVAVVVLGDLGRSPRMLYQAHALARAGSEVDLIGYTGSNLPDEITAHPGIRSWRITGGGPSMGGGALVTALRFFGVSLRALTLLLARVRRPDWVLVQNPPAFPTLALGWLTARLRRSRLAVDWHNLGYSMVALRFGERSRLVALLRRFEEAFGRRADLHLCVSKALRRRIEHDLGVRDVLVLPDRPAAIFRPLEASRRREVRRRLGLDGGESEHLVVSSTSWTADEDFDLLLEALPRVARALGETRLHVCITGRGGGRDAFLRRASALGAENLDVRCPWLPMAEYAETLAAADVGICLHRSSSGLDLPMKVLDMFGAGLPVLAYDYGPCLRELVRPGENGAVFSDAESLARELAALLQDPQRLQALRENVLTARDPDWETTWRNTVPPRLR